MPEYLAPGVYIEKTSFRSKSIEGVSTTTTGFVGPARYGPIDQVPDLITSLADFEATYGDGQLLVYKNTVIDNYLWHAVRAFFEEGGKRLYISRVFKSVVVDPNKVSENLAADGCVWAKIPADAKDEDALHIRARFPGAIGNMQVRLTLRVGQNVLGFTQVQDQPPKPRVVSLLPEDIVWTNHREEPTFDSAEQYFDANPTAQNWTWSFTLLPAAGESSSSKLQPLNCNSLISLRVMKYVW